MIANLVGLAVVQADGFDLRMAVTGVYQRARRRRGVWNIERKNGGWLNCWTHPVPAGHPSRGDLLLAVSVCLLVVMLS